MVRVLIRLVCPYCGELQWRVAEMGFWELRQLRKLLKNVEIDGKRLGDYLEIAEGEDVVALGSEGYMRSVEEARRDYKKSRVKSLEEIFREKLRKKSEG